MTRVHRFWTWTSLENQRGVYRLEVSTGSLEQVLDDAYEVLRVHNDGSVVYITDFHDQPLIKHPGAEPVPWQPGKVYQLGSHRNRGLPLGALGFLTTGVLEVHLADGTVLSWPWSSDEEARLVSVSPDGTSVALMLFEPHRLLFLTR